MSLHFEGKMTTQNPISLLRSVNADSESAHPTPDKDRPLTDEERERIREYYRSLNFKELLAVCPIDDIDFTREPEYPREVEL